MSATARISIPLTNVTTTPIVTAPFDVGNYDNMSVQLCVDSGAALSATLQVSNVKTSSDPSIPGQMRDDSVNSYDWAPAPSGGNIPSTAAGASNIGGLSVSAFKHARLKITSAGTTTAARAYFFAAGPVS